MRQAEQIFNAQQAEVKARHQQRITSKLQGYGEGIIHGWEAAAKSVADATNGLFTLQEPREVSEWRKRLKRSKVED